MASFGKRVDIPGGRRRIRRRQVHIVGSATSMGGSRSVIIQDLCLIGAKLLGRDLPPPGAEILLRTGDRAILGRVAWADDDHRGIVFGAPRRKVA